MFLRSSPNALKKRAIFYRAHFPKSETVYERLCVYVLPFPRPLDTVTLEKNQIHKGRSKGTKGKIQLKKL